MLTIYLQETDGTWTPFANKTTLSECLAYAQNRGINYKIEKIERGGKCTVLAQGTTGKFVQRRAKRA